MDAAQADLNNPRSGNKSQPDSCDTGSETLKVDVKIAEEMHLMTPWAV